MPAGSSSSSDPGAATRPWHERLPSTGIVVAGLVVLALGLRLWELDERAMHHDESLDAWWSWLFRNGRYERYDPVYHGPLRFYITAGFYELFGESEAVARLLSALTGTAAVGLPWFLRRELGRAGTIAAAAALTISPTMLYYSRFGREDAQMVFLTLLSLVLGIAYLRRPRTAVAAGLAFVLACSFAIKESTYLFALLLVVYLLVVLAAEFDRARTEPGRHSDDGPYRRSFFLASLALATLGLIVTVVVGARADELFGMLGLYVAGLVAFVLATAMPVLRSAGIEWSMARAATTVVGLAIAGQVVRSYGEPPGEWSASILALGTGAGLLGLAAVLAVLSRLSNLTDARWWAVAFGVGGLGLVGHEWLGRHVAGLNGAAEWQISLPTIAVTVLVAAVAVAVRFPQRSVELPPLLATPAARFASGPLLLVALALLANEYTESEADRFAALVAIAFTAVGISLVILARPTTTAERFRWPPLLRSLGAIGWTGWIITLAVFATSWFLFFTVWGRVKEDWASGFTRAIDYWDSQQEVNRGGQPWYYYLYALPAYEWFFVALASVGGWRALRRPTFTSGLFVWFALGSLIIYSYAGERMPWLIAHPLLPILVLAGYGIQHLWARRDHRSMPAIAVMCVAALLATGATSWRASFPNGADSREILSQAGQATPHVTAALERLDNIDRLSRQTTGEPATLAIGTANAWPYNWYLRDRPNVLWFDNESGPPDDPTVDVIIADYSVINTAEYPDFSATPFAMRSWWVPTYTEAGPRGWLAWARGRELWEQRSGSGFIGVREVDDAEVDDGLRARLDRLQHGADDASQSFVSFTGADDRPDVESPAFAEVDDGRDGCGSVDQWFLVRRPLADAERQAHPDPIEAMGPLECASDLIASQG